MRELRPGVWSRQAPHPDWDEEQWWPQLVSSHAIELGDDLVVFDPLAVPDELRRRATAVVLTAHYHERDARQLGSRTDVTRDDVVQRLQGLHDLSVEIVLPAHGPPPARAALHRALS